MLLIILAIGAFLFFGNTGNQQQQNAPGDGGIRIPDTDPVFDNGARRPGGNSDWEMSDVDVKQPAANRRNDGSTTTRSGDWTMEDVNTRETDDVDLKLSNQGDKQVDPDRSDSDWEMQDVDKSKQPPDDDGWKMEDVPGKKKGG